MATKNVSEGRMVKEFRRGMTVSSDFPRRWGWNGSRGFTLRRGLLKRNRAGHGTGIGATKGAREARGTPYVLILAIASLVKSAVRQFESLCEPFIYSLASSPPWTVENVTWRRKRKGWGGAGVEILAEAVILMRAVLKFNVTFPSTLQRDSRRPASPPRGRDTERGIKLYRGKPVPRFPPVLIRLCGLGGWRYCRPFLRDTFRAFQPALLKSCSVLSSSETPVKGDRLIIRWTERVVIRMKVLNDLVFRGEWNQTILILALRASLLEYFRDVVVVFVNVFW